MIDIGIAGAGYSGLTLALRLQQRGLDPLLYAEADPVTLRRGRLPNTVGRFPRALAREAALGVHDGAADDPGIGRIDVAAGPPLGVAYQGHLERPAQATDFRVLLPRMFELYLQRGGRVTIAPDLNPALLDDITGRHLITVVTVGRRSVESLFPVDAARSPHRQPLRLVFAGLFHGLAIPDRTVSLNLAPGVGEVVQMPITTDRGPATSLLVNAVPGGPLTPVVTRPPGEDGFAADLASRLRIHAPAVADRIDHRAFSLSGPLDHIQAAVVPTVRRLWRQRPDGRLAVAIGDAWITNDPITAQGANLGSHCAWVAAERIADQLQPGADHRGRPHRGPGRFDAAFGRRLERELWHQAGPVTAFTNAFLQAPPPHVVQLILAAAAHQEVADRYVNLFDDPRAMWSILSSPPAVEAFIDQALTGERSGRRAVEPAGDGVR